MCRMLRTSAHRGITRAASWKLLLVVMAVVCLAAANNTNAAVPSERPAETPAGVYSAPLFQMGGGMLPQGSRQVGVYPGSLLGPRWSDLFNADGTLRDAFGTGGIVGANGIAD